MVKSLAARTPRAGSRQLSLAGRPSGAETFLYSSTMGELWTSAECNKLLQFTPLPLPPPPSTVSGLQGRVQFAVQLHRKQHATRDGNVHVVPSHASTSCSWTLKGQPIDILQLDLKGILNESIDIQQLGFKGTVKRYSTAGLKRSYKYSSSEVDAGCRWAFNSVQLLQVLVDF